MRVLCFLLALGAAGLLPRSEACPKYCYCDSYEKDEYSVRCNGANITAIPRDIPKNTTMLDISFTPITMLRKGDFVDMPKLKQLNVWWNLNLTIVELGTFDNLPTITSLGLYNNSFTKLPTGLLDSLKNLKTFDAHNSKLEMIQHGLFTNHPALQEIRLFFNYIATLEDAAFGGLPHLTTLYLSSNSLKSLNPSAFKGSPKLKSLNAGDNAIISIGKDTFVGTNFESIYLSRNAIYEVDTNAFSHMKGLQYVSLDQNNIKGLKGVFKDLPQLQSVSVYGNHLTSIEGAFQNLPKLDSLEVSGNQISKISKTTFDGAPALTSLTINNNAITEVESGAFRNLDRLLTLYIDHNQIPEISLAGLRSLQTLTIHSNNLHSFPSNLEDANQLEYLWLNNNPIEEPLNEQFSVLHRLSNLLMSNITSLKLAGTLNPKALCGSDALGAVWLNYNGLTSIPPTTFECTPYISTIWLSNNSLTELSPRLFRGLTELSSLHLSNNQLSRLDPDTFLGLGKLRSLYLSGNNFTNMAHVAPAIANLPILLYQALDYNPIVYLGRESFPMPMKHVNSFSVSKSHLRVIDEGAFSDVTFPNLTRLELEQDDSLHFLPGNMLEGLDNLTTMIAYGDPFHCDCQLKAFVTWLRERVNPPYVSATCASPPSLQGKDLTDIPLASLTCDCQQVAPPSIDTSGSDNFTHEGQTAMLNCKISGCPVAEFVWTTPTGAMLAVESGFPRMEVLSSGTLVVTDAREEDTGVYTCTAVNYRGKTSKEVALHVGNKH
ncbi:PREDICTED: insulin-like growth factor-binding protein complex acid labile subunit isoform X3 [Branchiostoma belcheri]|uniref:Insulin-like growth factor-binding protein complex acid labile subunit isoform X3 n=1 Tax=Branchiostoma belcheri TaxID=7741 RepID=A0A6P4Z3I4_BRABE|nr:PREDICTED: insulin-like growth factor-binding protein complex acid labile subunit isoform X3 [Branchiostoma belcheri]